MRGAIEVRRVKDGRKSWAVADVETRMVEMRSERTSVSKLVAETSPAGRAGREAGMGIPLVPITRVRTGTSRSGGVRQGSAATTANQRSSDRLRLTLPALSELNSKAMTKRGQLLQKLSDRLLQDEKFLSDKHVGARQIDFPKFKQLVSPHLGQDTSEFDHALLSVFEEIAREKKVWVDLVEIKSFLLRFAFPSLGSGLKDLLPRGRSSYTTVLKGGRPVSRGFETTPLTDFSSSSEYQATLPRLCALPSLDRWMCERTSTKDTSLHWHNHLSSISSYMGRGTSLADVNMGASVEPKVEKVRILLDMEPDDPDDIMVDAEVVLGQKSKPDEFLDELSHATRRPWTPEVMPTTFSRRQSGSQSFGRLAPINKKHSLSNSKKGEISSPGEASDPLFDATVAYEEKCTNLGVRAIPVVISSPNATQLYLENCGITEDAVEPLATLFRSRPHLALLDMRGNKVGTRGIAAFCRNGLLEHLTTLVLDDNSLEVGVDHMTEHLKAVKAIKDGKEPNIPRNFDLYRTNLSDRCSLTNLSLAKNHIPDTSIAALARAILEVELNIVDLDIQGNLAGAEAGAALGEFLSSNSTLTRLNVGWNCLRAGGARALTDGLKGNSSLVEFLASWNGFGDEGPCSSLCNSLLCARALRKIDLSRNRVADRGALMLASTIENCRWLQEVVLDDNPLGQVGGRALVKASVSHTTGSSAEDCEDGYVEGRVSMKNCNVGSIDPHSFDPSNPAGNYDLDMAKSYSQVVVRNLVALAARGRGEFASGVTLNGRPFALSVTKAIEDLVLPDLGQLQFGFNQSFRPPRKEDAVPASEISYIKKMMQERRASGVTSRDVIDMTCKGDSYFSTSHAIELVKSCEAGAERATCAGKALFKLIDPTDKKQLLSCLNQMEINLLESQASKASLDFVGGNPTGQYLLDLSLSIDRDLLKFLLGLAVSQVDEEQRAKKRGRKGDLACNTSTPIPDRHFLNMLLSNVPYRGDLFSLSQKDRGKLKLDFVSTAKPGHNEEILPHDTLQRICSDCSNGRIQMPPANESGHPPPLNAQCPSAAELQKEIPEQIRKEEMQIVLEIRIATNNFALLRDQAVRVLLCLRAEESRCEWAVCCFARLRDWHGYTDVLKCLTRAENQIVEKRLGKHNLYDNLCAVGYYELDLSSPSDRWIAAELTRLAVLEPGENLIEETYDGMDFTMPAAWTKEIPTKGEYCCFYCREARTIDEILREETQMCGPGKNHMRKFADPIIGPITASEMHEMLPSTVPPTFYDHQLAGTEWTVEAKYSRIKRKLEEKFPSGPEEAFNALDDDGGGSLSRGELATGLRAVGLWLHPNEMSALLEVLDEDGSGDIDVDELKEFWYKY